MMRKRRFCFTLLEVAISLFLVGILLSFLFGFFWHISISKNKNRVLKEKTFRLELCYLRLDHLFSHFNPEKGCFLTALTHPEAVGPALLIYSDQNTDRDNAYSGFLHSMLYKTRDHRLCLCRWSQERVSKVDILLDKVEDVSFAFFSDNAWISTLPKKKEKKTPIMVKISLLLAGEEKEHRQDFIFSLGSETIFYEMKKL